MVPEKLVFELGWFFYGPEYPFTSVSYWYMTQSEYTEIEL